MRMQERLPSSTAARKTADAWDFTALISAATLAGVLVIAVSDGEAVSLVFGSIYLVSFLLFLTLNLGYVSEPLPLKCQDLLGL